MSYRLIQACCAERSRSLRWLTYAQVGRFPDLIATVQERTQVRLREALADRLGRLCAAGRLRAADPVQAAEQLLALLTAPMEIRSRLGTRRVPAAEARKVAEAAVETFLCAYA
ncbi:TetR/AcrR family transcriptional regulator C-terminal domain-containing protein [Fodinicola feengrottensis]|uniref:TetR/AcrR family transcriptional regulator C-terminal domain-containing protein n=1 Tax=Fodinicola feengrottensis TaxID=435914 RepID=UPI00244327D6|nr:TetR/AcrR family transcriptional regulator C-terminal domain-containing protein [Fodinicola feengrottensis]